MAKVGTIPSLTVDGFINNKKIQMGKLFEYYLASDYSQSNTFNGQVCSLKYVLAMNNDTESIKKAIAVDLETLYGSHFDKIESNILVVEPEGTGKMNVHIDLIAYHNNETYTLTKELVYSNGDIEQFGTLLDEYYETYRGN